MAVAEAVALAVWAAAAATVALADFAAVTQLRSGR